MYKNKKLISIGNFLFKHRNYVFPLLILVIFIIIPPKSSFLGSEELEDSKDWIAFVIALFGLGIRGAVIGFAYIKRGGLNKKVYADDLVTTGIFAICRNPLYVGNIIIYFSIFLMHGSFIVLVFGTTLFLFIYISLVAAEENFLSDKFGDVFEEYCNKTSRWLPNIFAIKSAVQGMEFDYKKVILKDYTTMFNTLAIIFGIELYEEIALEGNYINGIILITAIIILALMVFLVKGYKKKQSVSVTASSN